jgi:hypothetical protein
MTKVMSWNIENFTHDKISTNIALPLRTWQTGLNNYYIHAVVKPTSLAFLLKAVSDFPWPVYVVPLSNEQTAFNWYKDNLLKKVIDVAVTLELAAAPGETPKNWAGKYFRNVKAYITGVLPSGAPNLNGIETKLNFPGAHLGTILARLKGNIAGFNPVMDDSAPYVIIKWIFEQVWGVLHTNQNLMIGEFPAILEILHDNTPYYYLRDINLYIQQKEAASKEQTVLRNINDNLFPNGPTSGPDIFTVLEVISGSDVGSPQYNTIDGTGASGIMLLLDYFRKKNPNYCLIPPVRLSNNALDLESIGIFYDSSKLKFKGPQKWTGNQAKPLVDPLPIAGYGAATWAPHAYPAVATNNVIVGNALPDRQVTINREKYNEYELAAQTIFFNKRVKIEFLESGKRPPVLAFFEEIVGNRLIKILAMHTNRNVSSNASKSSVNALAKIKDISEMEVSGTSIALVVGDFNNAFLKKVRYDEVKRNLQDYDFVFNPYQITSNNRWPSMLESVYLTTTMTTSGDINLLNKAFPGYGYLKVITDTKVVPNVDLFESLDNMFIRPKGTAYSGAMILNRVVGVNHQKAADSKSKNATFGYGTTATRKTDRTPYGYLMNESIDEIKAKLAPSAAVKRLQFISLENYGGLIDTSDHLALVVEF